MKHSPLAIAAALLLVGCSEYDVSKVQDLAPSKARIEVAPEVLNYGEVASGDESTKIFTIRSVGQDALVVEDVYVRDSGAFTLVAPDADTILEPGEEIDVAVTYAAGGEEDSGWAVVESTDPTRSESQVALVAGTSFPMLRITPGLLELNSAPNYAVQGQFQMSNIGTADLELFDVQVSGDALTGPMPPSSDHLAPGESAYYTVSFYPDALGEYPGTLVVDANTPLGTHTADILGIAQDQPVAVCSVAPTPAQALIDTVTWIGSASFDPSGAVITTYNWSLLRKPAASSAAMPYGGANRSFIPDAAGTYEAELVVTNDHGISSEPCRVTVDAEMAQSLWIELAWAHAGDDMDLHLVRPGGSLTTSGDCYYANCVTSSPTAPPQLEWGASPDNQDDPRLDRDDIPGTGSENTNIYEPYDGVYGVYVHDYPGSVYNGSNDTLVNIYIGGILQWSDTRPLTTEDEYYHYADVDWAGGTGTVIPR